MNKECILKLAQLIKENPTFPVMAWVDAETLDSDFDYCTCNFKEEPRVQWFCYSDDPTDLEVKVSDTKKDDGKKWEGTICIYLMGC